jgi:(p)ppGpp synthase/HD superfamily hydrolase
MDFEMCLAAAALARSAHKGQTDRAGRPYIEHPTRVAQKAKTFDEYTVAMLHDVAEDCPEWPLARLAEHFPPNIIAALECLTKRPGEDYEAFIERVATNPLAVRVKLADLADNSDLTRLPRVTDKDRERNAKYARATARLQEVAA